MPALPASSGRDRTEQRGALYPHPGQIRVPSCSPAGPEHGAVNIVGLASASSARPCARRAGPQCRRLQSEVAANPALPEQPRAPSPSEPQIPRQPPPHAHPSVGQVPVGVRAPRDARALPQKQGNLVAASNFWATHPVVGPHPAGLTQSPAGKHRRV